MKEKQIVVAPADIEALIPKLHPQRIAKGRKVVKTRAELVEEARRKLRNRSGSPARAEVLPHQFSAFVVPSRLASRRGRTHGKRTDGACRSEHGCQGLQPFGTRSSVPRGAGEESRRLIDRYRWPAARNCGRTYRPSRAAGSCDEESGNAKSNAFKA